MYGIFYHENNEAFSMKRLGKIVHLIMDRYFMQSKNNQLRGGCPGLVVM